MEILDHVASAVEAKLDENSKKSLSQAIQEVHSGFGVFGFATIEEEKQKYFHQLVKKEFLTNFKSFFKGENLLINATLFIGLFVLMSFVKLPSEPVFSLFFLIITLSAGVYISYTNYLRFKKWKNKSLMLSTSASLLYLFQPVFGQVTGTIYQGIAEVSPQAAIIFFSSTLFLLVISTIAAYKTMNWGYNWTYERYLKYAD